MASKDLFLEIDGIPGESADSTFKGQIDLDGWGWQASNSGSMHQGGGGGSGKSSFSDLSCQMRVSKATPKIFEHIALGTHIPKAVLRARKAGGKQEVYLTITMEDLLISSYSTGGSGGDMMGSDSLSMNFAKVTYEYKEQDDKGQVGSAIVFKYDIKGNTA